MKKKYRKLLYKISIFAAAMSPFARSACHKMNWFSKKQQTSRFGKKQQTHRFCT